MWTCYYANPNYNTIFNTGITPVHLSIISRSKLAHHSMKYPPHKGLEQITKRVIWKYGPCAICLPAGSKEGLGRLYRWNAGAQ